MMALRSVVLAAAAVTGLALMHAPVAAQDDVMRDAFGFYGSSLEVQVETEAAGRIRFMRGQRSRIEVAGRAPNGFTSAALGGHGVRRLTLSSMGADRVDFVVVVPEDVRVRVRWPGASRSELFGTLSQTASYAWATPIDRPAFETVRPDRAARVAASSTAVRVVDVGAAHRLDRLTLRIGGSRFDISGAHAEARGAPGALHIDAPGGGDIGIDVPANRPFTLRLDGADAVVVDGADVRVLCESFLAQTLADGSRWLTLTPVPRGGCTVPDEAPAHPRMTPATRRT